MTFNEVARQHKTIRGIYAIDGVAVSLLCTAGVGAKYPNQIGDAKITYFTGPTTTPRDVASLSRTMELRSPVRVYFKESSNNWKDRGCFIVTSHVGAATDAWQRFELAAVG